MRGAATLLSLLRVLAAAATQSAGDSGLQVSVYEGPTECEDVDRVKSGDMLAMSYTGKIDMTSATGVRGKQFDSSRGRDDFEFTIGLGQVIRGWDEGLLGLCKGAKATLVVPPEMGYGARGGGPSIPGGATLNFDVEVIKIGATPPPRNVFAEIDADQVSIVSTERTLPHGLHRRHRMQRALSWSLVRSVWNRAASSR